MAKHPPTQLERLRAQKQRSKIREASSHGIKQGAIDPNTLRRTNVAAHASAFGRDFTQSVLESQKKVNDPKWEELAGVGSSIGQGVYEFACAVGDNARTVTAAGKSDAIFNNTIKAAMDDCISLSNDLKAIKAQHEGRTGVIVTAEDFELYYRLGGDYNNLWERFQTLSFQATAEITQHLSAVTTKIDPDQNVEKVVDQTLQDHVDTSTEAKH